MTRERDIERVLERWLVDGIDEMPDRTYLTILDRVERQPQQRAWRVSWRDSPMNRSMKALLAAAAIVVIAVVGWNVLPGRSDGVGGSTSSPSPAASSSPSPVAPASSPPAVSASPSASAVFPAWYTSSDSNGAGILPAGSQTTTWFSPGFRYDVPQGWVNPYDETGYFALFPDTPANQAEFGRSEGLAHEFGMGFRNDPYFTCDEWETNQGANAAEIVAAMGANDALATSEPVDVTIGGLTGKQIDVQLDPDWTERCPGDPHEFDLADGRTRAILLDTPDRGVLVMFIVSMHSAGHEDFLAEVMPVIESFEFDTGQ